MLEQWQDEEEQRDSVPLLMNKEEIPKDGRVVKVKRALVTERGN